jgi:hypothetical protein
MTALHAEHFGGCFTNKKALMTCNRLNRDDGRGSDFTVCTRPTVGTHLEYYAFSE